MIFILLKTTTFVVFTFHNKYLVPDEEQYSRLTCLLNEGLIRPAEFQFYFSWGPAFLLLSQFLNFISLPCLVSTRATSLVFSILSALVFYKLINEIPSSRKNNFSSMLVNLSFIFFLFEPSKFFWSSLGIREANIEFLVISNIYLITKLSQVMPKNKKYFFTIAFFISLIALSFTRIFLFYCLAVVFLMYLIIKKIRKKWSLELKILISAFLFSLVIPPISIATVTKVNELVLEQKIENLERDTTSSVTNKRDEIAKLSQELQVTMNSHGSPIKISINFQSPEYGRLIRSINAKSEVSLNGCESSSKTIFSRLVCNVKYFPTGLGTVLFRPNPFNDWYSTSTQLASFANLLYLSLLILTIFLLFKFNFEKEFYLLSFIPSLFILFSISGLALYGGNVGTIFRHRSVTIWAISFILILIAVYHKNPKRTDKKLSF
jgi:hypothetical protein